MEAAMGARSQVKDGFYSDVEMQKPSHGTSLRNETTIKSADSNRA
jgi:hypothetical protein